MSTFSDLVAGVDRAAQDLLGGELVTYTPAVGAPVPVTGIFDAQYVLVKGDAHAGVAALGPAVSIRLEDLPEDPMAADVELPSVTIGGTVYHATDAVPGGMGLVVLHLRSAG